MQQFIPFEDDWDALEALRPEDLIPYRVGFLDVTAAATHSTLPTLPSSCSSSPARTPMRAAVPAASSRT
jgi:hypothetical protein